MNNDSNDERQVSAAYKGLASERAPEHLDSSVLRMARARVQHLPYSRWTSWSRPLAWAATVALCLAITLEVMQVTTPEDTATEAAPAAVATPAPSSDRDQAVDIQDSMADSINSEKISPARSAAKQLANEALPEAAFEARQEPVQRHAERSAAAADSSAGYAAAAAIAADVPDDECSAEVRAEPETWLECIAALKAAGDQQAASRQRQMLIDTFPDFNLP
jgi:hypothetical protein